MLYAANELISVIGAQFNHLWLGMHTVLDKCPYPYKQQIDSSMTIYFKYILLIILDMCFANRWFNYKNINTCIYMHKSLLLFYGCISMYLH